MKLFFGHTRIILYTFDVLLFFTFSYNSFESDEPLIDTLLLGKHTNRLNLCVAIAWLSSVIIECRLSLISVYYPFDVVKVKIIACLQIPYPDMMLYQYFVEVVPTDVSTLLRTYKTFQYSVKDHQRPVDHHKGSHGIPGIFFKYDMSALKVKVTQERDSLFRFLVKLCATVGGIFVTNGLLNSLVQMFWYLLACKFLNRQDLRGEQKLVVSPSMVEQRSSNPVNLTASPATLDLNINPQ